MSEWTSVWRVLRGLLRATHQSFGIVSYHWDRTISFLCILTCAFPCSFWASAIGAVCSEGRVEGREEEEGKEKRVGKNWRKGGESERNQSEAFFLYFFQSFASHPIHSIQNDLMARERGGRPLFSIFSEAEGWPAVRPSGQFPYDRAMWFSIPAHENRISGSFTRMSS